jgi:predicted RNA-binding Zn-ribbon protein involved in translation (DUF1610 family)
MTLVLLALGRKSMTSAVVNLSCLNCGAELQITPDVERFTCVDCGAEQIVIRGAGIVSLQPVGEGLQRAGKGADKRAAELAIAQLVAEVAMVEGELQALWDTRASTYRPATYNESLLFTVVLVLLLIGLMLVAGRSFAGGGASLLLGFSFFVWWLQIYRNRLRDGEQIRQREFNRSMNRLKSLWSALQENRRIAES